MTFGTSAVPAESARFAQIANVNFADDMLIVHLDDGRELHLEMTRYVWLQWLRNATPEKRAHWEIVPSGGGVWWPELDDGIELQHLPDLQSLR